MLTHKRYAKKILEEAGMRDCNRTLTPMESGLKLSKAEEEEDIDATSYRKNIGCLRYLVHTRPDLTYCIRVLSRYMQAPKVSHGAAMKQVLRYLQGTEHWRLKKSIIGFKYVPDHKGKTLANTLLQCLADWGIENVFTVTVDNATANSNALGEFQSTFSLIRADSLVLNGDYMHMRCAGHIINLIVRDGMAEMDSSVTAVRKAISYVRSGPNRRKAFEMRVETGRFTKGSLPLDVTTRWNSSYLMLTRAIKFQGAFDRMDMEDKLYNDYFLEYENGEKRIGPPLMNDWRKIERFVKFLNVFYQATLVVSASTTLNAHKCYSEIVNIAMKLQLLCLNSDTDVKVNAEKMYKKSDKYWDGIQNINIMLIIASVFDPRKKMEFANLCFVELYGEDSTTAKGLNESVLIVMRVMYKEYSERYVESTSQASSQSESSSQFNEVRQTDGLFDSMEDEFDG
ncbi:PREDICTED: zinc finger BED domain-containing protein RICESLEEPER 2-like [Camelina sativa]|uniref:Zinc finger BED domain-containing protein RICESLEEPER 2-like n=1 Tax=Camelina sativa TaxID=90675 RepID=A0ABM0YWS9_CAMSA|nr:PREDICTED: zinc finger BED domain-containing protein RICESLEEPER 2-like [Camelina sativa]